MIGSVWRSRSRRGRAGRGSRFVIAAWFVAVGVGLLCTYGALWECDRQVASDSAEKSLYSVGSIGIGMVVAVVVVALLSRFGDRYPRR